MYDGKRMSGMSQVRRFVAFICLVMVVLAALAPGAVELPPAILVPLTFFIALSVTLPLVHVEKQNRAPRFLALPAFSPRPPPAR
jgi:hypothetical protein